VTALRIVDKPPWGDREVGMMWRYPSGDEGGRECWWVVLPMTHPDIGKPGHPGEISWRTTDRASTAPHQMWGVTGTPPVITVTPSLDVCRFVKGPVVDGKQTYVREGSYWHGFITNGELVGA
jgi:hypothetical protein